MVAFLKTAVFFSQKNHVDSQVFSPARLLLSSSLMNYFVPLEIKFPPDCNCVVSMYCKLYKLCEDILILTNPPFLIGGHTEVTQSE